VTAPALVVAPGRRLTRPELPVPLRTAALAALILINVSVLAALHVAGIGGVLELAMQATLVAAFVGLVVVDFRAAVALAILELAVAGASGRWTVFPGGISGRIMLDGIVFAAALVHLALVARRRGRLFLGRYGLHAVVVGALLTGIWIPLGIANGWRVGDAWGDGNGYAFLAFTLVLAALAAGHGIGWIRRWLLIACAASAVITVVLLTLVILGLPPSLIRQVAIRGLEMGGHVGVYYGDLRLYLGSGLYFVVGVALVSWELLERPRRIWPWLLLGVFAVALFASDTRGFWLASGVAVVLLALVMAPSLRRIAALAGAALLVAAVLTVAGLVAGFNVPGYLYDRLITSIVFVEPPEDIPPQYLGRGVGSNATKVHQAQVLIGHIAERPIQGWGFGAIAPDYRYGKTYAYELTYIALAYKAGIVGLLIFLTFPLRLLLDAVRVRLGRLRAPPGLDRRDAAVPIAVLVALLLVGATNPYLVAAFGLAPVILMIAWLDPFEGLAEG
jgi:hypothetical protein